MSMVSYSRLRPAMSRDDPRRLLPAAAAGGVGAALVRGGSVPVVLMLSPSGRLARVATDKEELRFVKGRCLPRLRPAASPVSEGRLGLPVEAVHGRGQAAADDGLDRVGAARDDVGQHG